MQSRRNVASSWRLSKLLPFGSYIQEKCRRWRYLSAISLTVDCDDFGHVSQLNDELNENLLFLQTVPVGYSLHWYIQRCSGRKFTKSLPSLCVVRRHPPRHSLLDVQSRHSEASLHISLLTKTLETFSRHGKT